LEEEKRSNNVKTGTQKGKRTMQVQAGEHLSRNWGRRYMLGGVWAGV